MTTIRSLANLYLRRRFACLFFSLLITLVAAPVLASMGFSNRFMELFLVVNIFAAVVVTLFGFGTYVGLGLLALVLILRTGHALLGFEPLLSTSHGGGAAIFLVSICILLRFILSEGTVNSERIFAALDAYLLVGVMCGLLFSIFETQWPGSLSFQGLPLAESKQNPLAHTIYFSFVTMATVGYGDIVPVGGPARALAVAEAISCQMYLVVIVARLVTLHQGEEDNRNDHSAPR